MVKIRCWHVVRAQGIGGTGEKMCLKKLLGEVIREPLGGEHWTERGDPLGGEKHL